MILPVFAIYDSKALYYATPHTQQNADLAIRAFTDIVNEPGNRIYSHPTDFSLIEIGTLDDETGVLTPCAHINHGLASQFKKG